MAANTSAGSRGKAAREHETPDRGDEQQHLDGRARVGQLRNGDDERSQQVEGRLAFADRRLRSSQVGAQAQPRLRSPTHTPHPHLRLRSDR